MHSLKMALKFAANLNFLFTEEVASLSEKIYKAHNAGFRAVEIPFPNCNQNKVIEAVEKTGIEVALMNIALGPDCFQFGSSSIPNGVETFKLHLRETVDLAKCLKCKKIHIMAGIVKDQSIDNHLITYLCNLKYTATILEKENLIGLIEPINKYALPGYFLNSYKTALDVLKEVNSNNLKLMLDIFHLQHIHGNVSYAFKEMSDVIGHIQIAQVPSRNEPDVVGELDYKYIFDLITKHKYNDWIGCEYKPQTTTIEGLKWISKFNLRL